MSTTLYVKEVRVSSGPISCRWFAWNRSGLHGSEAPFARDLRTISWRTLNQGPEVENAIERA